jgi:uncharacterized protein YxjI
MGFLRRQDEPEGTRYQMREKLFAIGDDFWVQTDGGERVFKVDGKAMRVRSTFILESASGEELFKIQERKLRVRDTMEVERDGDTVATIKKALISPIHDRFAIEVKNGAELSAKGNILEHEYEIERDGHKVADARRHPGRSAFGGRAAPTAWPSRRRARGPRAAAFPPASAHTRARARRRRSRRRAIRVAGR